MLILKASGFHSLRYLQLYFLSVVKLGFSDLFLDKEKPPLYKRRLKVFSPKHTALVLCVKKQICLALSNAVTPYLSIFLLFLKLIRVCLNLSNTDSNGVKIGVKIGVKLKRIYSTYIIPFFSESIQAFSSPLRQFLGYNVCIYPSSYQALHDPLFFAILLRPHLSQSI